MSPTEAALAVFLLGTICTGAVLAAVFYPAMAARAALGQRMARIAPPSTAAGRKSGALDESRRKRSIEATLREVDEKLRAKVRQNTKLTLVRRMRQGHIRWSKTTYFMVCAATAAGAWFAIWSLTGWGTLPSAVFGVSAGLLFPHLYVDFRRNRRLKRFAAEFPNAVDVIVRGVKAGLPLVDCLRIIATEAQQPVRDEFKTLIEDQTLGMPLDDAVQRLADRVPLAEASFFAIVIALQSRTGGNLSEALGNLSRVLRDRKKMRAKIKAMSAEAKTSGIIIGVLPIAVGGILLVTSPTYIALLFTTLTGKVVLGACVVWMIIGIVVMRKMINFNL